MSNSTITPENPDPCGCEVYERCPKCDPAHFRKNMETRPAARVSEQEEAAIVDAVMSAVEERVKGLRLQRGVAYREEDNTLYISIVVPGKANRCRVQINLEV